MRTTFRDVVLEETSAEWVRVRPTDSVDVLPRLLNDEQKPFFRVLAIMAFEAGRRYQNKHPETRIGVPVLER